jgi:hypothetical protein
LPLADRKEYAKSKSANFTISQSTNYLVELLLRKRTQFCAGLTPTLILQNLRECWIETAHALAECANFIHHMRKDIVLSPILFDQGE